jgi:5-deoxy-glucuronate isomerase
MPHGQPEEPVNRTAHPREKVVFRATDAKPGRHLSVTPANSATTHLSYGRIILGPTCSSVSFDAGQDEVGLVCFDGSASVTISGHEVPFPMTRHDALYIPRDASITITTTATVDIAEFRAPVDHHYPLQYVKATEVEADPGLCFRAGGDNTSRTLRILLGKNVQAGRLMAGVTVSDPGHWTSWPPHEHADLAEEMYVYYDMPKEAFAIQMVYNDAREPEHVEVVRSGDAVIMANGYHPNVSVPGHVVRFLWIMAANRETEDRRFGVVNVHPDFAQTSSGLDKGR